MSVPRVSAPLTTAFPKLTAKLVAGHGGPDVPWFQLLRAFWLRTGGQTGTDSQATANDVATLDVLTALPPLPEPKPVPVLPVAITPGASPFAYQAPWTGTLWIVGGTVSGVTFSRDGATTFTLPNAGPVPVFEGDVVAVTYSVVPTMFMVMM